MLNRGLKRATNDLCQNAFSARDHKCVLNLLLPFCRPFLRLERSCNKKQQKKVPTKKLKGVTHAHLGPIWYEPSDISYDQNQFLG